MKLSNLKKKFVPHLMNRISIRNKEVWYKEAVQSRNERELRKKVVQCSWADTVGCV